MAMKVRYTVLDGQIVSENRGGVERDYVPDPLGSTVALLDSTQTKTDTFTYWPYGEVKTRTGTTATPFQFVGTAGYFQDSSTKTYVRARYLDTQKGRWLTEDSITERASYLQPYWYGNDSPTTRVDLTGAYVGALLGGANTSQSEQKPPPYRIPPPPFTFPPNPTGRVRCTEWCFGELPKMKGRCEAEFISCILQGSVKVPKSPPDVIVAQCDKAKTDCLLKGYREYYKCLIECVRRYPPVPKKECWNPMDDNSTFWFWLHGGERYKYQID